MKRIAQFAVLATTIALGIVQTQAATTVKTNWTLSVNIMLIASEGGSAKPTAISTKSVLAALGQTAAGTKLLFIQSGTNSTFVVREGHTDTDVTSHFSRTSGLVVSTTAGPTTIDRSVDTFTFTGTNLTFGVSGFTTEVKGPSSAHGDTVTKSLSAKVAGEGDIGATGSNNAVLQGSISLNGGHLE